MGFKSKYNSIPEAKPISCCAVRLPRVGLVGASQKKGKLSHFAGFLFIDSDYNAITVQKFLQTTHMNLLLSNSTWLHLNYLVWKFPDTEYLPRKLSCKNWARFFPFPSKKKPIDVILQPH